MNFEELRAEWNRPQRRRTRPAPDTDRGYGPKIVRQVRRICAQTSKGYLAKTYSLSPRADTEFGDVWDEDDLAELVSRAWEWLLKNDQFNYAFDLARDINHWNDLIGKQIRSMLIHRDNKTVIDNLMKNSLKILKQPPFESLSGTKHTWYRLGAKPDPELADPDDVGLDRLDGFEDAMRRVAQVPQQDFDMERARERAPRIYNEPELRTCLEGIAIAYPHGFTNALVEKVFKNIFTFLDPTGLTSLEVHTEGGEEGETVENTVADLEHANFYDSLTEREVLCQQSAAELLERFDEKEREILRRWAHKESQDKIGKDLNLGVRQTVATRIDKLVVRLNAFGNELINDGLTAEEMEQVNAEFTRLLCADSGDQSASYE